MNIRVIFLNIKRISVRIEKKSNVICNSKKSQECKYNFIFIFLFFIIYLFGVIDRPFITFIL